MQFKGNEEKTKSAVIENAVSEQETEDATTDVALSSNAPEGVIRFKTPYVFEGNTISELDLRGLKGLSYSAIQKQMMPLYEMLSEGDYSSVPETTNEFIIAAAVYATKLPVEFFISENGLRFCHFFKMRTLIRNFLLQEV